MSVVAAAEAREKSLWNRAEADGSEFRETLSADFIAVYAGAVNDAAAEVAAIGQQKLDSFTLSDLEVRELAAGVELVTYSAAAKGRFEGSDISGNYRATSIWKRDGGQWKLAYHSEMKSQ